MWTIIICDDEPLFAETLKKNTEEIFRELECQVQINLFCDGRILADQVLPAADLYFLDIRMPQISGLELASRIRQRNNRSCIIFVTSVDDAVYQVFPFQPLRFLRKDRLDCELEEAIHAFLGQMYKRKPQLLLHSSDGDILVSICDILYLDTDGHYLNVHTPDSVYRIRGKLSEYQELKEKSGFLKPNQSYLVNCRWILKILGSEITLQSGEHIYISRALLKETKSAYLQYIRGIEHEHFV